MAGRGEDYRTRLGRFRSRDLAVAICAARGTRAAEGGGAMSGESQLVRTSELFDLQYFADRSERAKRKAVERLLKTLKPRRRGAHREHQYELADVIERLSSESSEAAADLLQMRAARTAPIAAPATTPIVAATVIAEELAAFEDNWEDASDDSRERSARHVAYVQELKAELPQRYTERDRNRACRVVAGRHGVYWVTIQRAALKVHNRPAEIWRYLLLDKNRGRGRREYERKWDRTFRSFCLARTAPAYSVCRDLTCKSITKMDVAAARRAGIRVPTTKALLDRLRSELSEEAILLARCGADAVAARHHQDRDYSSLTAGEALNGDGHRCDWFVKWPDGYVGRPVIFAFQCLFTGAVTGWRVDRTENQDLVRLAAADAFRRALPNILSIDNGRAGASKWLTGGVGLGWRFRFKTKVEDAIGVFRLLGLDVRFTNPYAGRSKRIERFWGDLESHLRARPELRLAYAGNGKDEAAENGAAHAVTLETFIRVLGDEVLSYNSRGHEELWNQSVASGAVLRKATELQLRLLLLAAQKVRIHAKDGCIHLFGNRYEVADARAGSDVIVRFDPARLHDDLHLYDREGRYLGAAKCVAPVGFADHGAARETARLNKVRKRALRAELEAQDLIDRIELGMTLPQIESPAPAAAKVVRPFRSPIEAPRAREAEVFDSSLDIYDGDQKQVG